MLTLYFFRVKSANFPEFYIDKSNLDFKKYINQVKKDYTDYKKNKTGYRDILESENIEIIKIDRCYGSEEFANETYKEILYNQRNNMLMFINLKNIYIKKIHHYKTYKTYKTIIIYLCFLLKK